MNNKGSTQDLFNLIKTIVDNYMRSRKPAALFLGTYTGSAIMIETLPVPMSMVRGNMVSRLQTGDKVRLCGMTGEQSITFWRLWGSRILPRLESDYGRNYTGPGGSGRSIYQQDL